MRYVSTRLVFASIAAIAMGFLFAGALAAPPRPAAPAADELVRLDPVAKPASTKL